MHFNVYDVFYSQFSHQYVSAAFTAIFVVILLQEYKCTMQLFRRHSTKIKNYHNFS